MSFAFLKKCTFPDGKLPRHVDLSGNSIEVARNTYYTEMFGAMGCAQYYRICKKPEVKALAELYFDYIYAHYMEQHTANQEEQKERNGKCFGLYMAILAAVQFVRNAGVRSEKADEIASIAIDQIMNGGFINDEKDVFMSMLLFREKKSKREMIRYLLVSVMFMKLHGLLCRKVF